MNNQMKAKILIELLDDRKYSVLSSFSAQELTKLNNVDLESLNNVTGPEMTTIIDEFLSKINQKKETDSQDSTPDKPVAPPKPVVKASKPLEKEPKKVVQTLAQKLQQQPPQLLACVLKRVGEDQRKIILNQLSKETKQLVESIEVENTPISDDVVKVILHELELTSK
jgi:flagellar motor switch protein FliG